MARRGTVVRAGSHRVGCLPNHQLVFHGAVRVGEALEEPPGKSHGRLGSICKEIVLDALEFLVLGKGGVKELAHDVRERMVARLEAANGLLGKPGEAALPIFKRLLNFCRRRVISATVESGLLLKGALESEVLGLKAMTCTVGRGDVGTKIDKRSELWSGAHRIETETLAGLL